MSTMGRRQASADNDKLDLSKKTIRDVAIELARRSQPVASPSRSTQPVSAAFQAAPGETVMPLMSSAPKAGPTDAGLGQCGDTGSAGTENSATGADQTLPRDSGNDEGAVSGPERTDAKLIKIGLRENQLQAAHMPGAWASQRPFKEDVTGRAPLEALSRALDHWQIDQQDEFAALTPSSEMTTDLGPAPMVAAPSPAAATDEPAPGESAASSNSISKNTKPRGTIPMAAPDDGHRRTGLRHFPARPSRLKKFFDTNFNTLRSTNLGLASSRVMRQSPQKRLHPFASRLAKVDWPTLAGGLVIGTLVGLGVAAIVLPVAAPVGYGARSPVAPAALSEAPGAMPHLNRVSASQTTAVLPTENQLQGRGAVATRTRPSIASTVGIPAAMQPSGPAILGSVPATGAPAAPMVDTALPKTAATAKDAAVTAGGSVTQQASPPKPAKSTTKSTAKRTTGRQTTGKADAPLSSAKR
ncbi:MAG TPA: hypothetical protein VND94_14725 [Terriglobia bacterium]|nr:hypothetical protein [Terriglobia bacterium]